jgi:hypothetical protein
MTTGQLFSLIASFPDGTIVTNMGNGRFSVNYDYIDEEGATVRMPDDVYGNHVYWNFGLVHLAYYSPLQDPVINSEIGRGQRNIRNYNSQNGRDDWNASSIMNGGLQLAGATVLIGGGPEDLIADGAAGVILVGAALTGVTIYAYQRLRDFGEQKPWTPTKPDPATDFYRVNRRFNYVAPNPGQPKMPSDGNKGLLYLFGGISGVASYLLFKDVPAYNTTDVYNYGTVPNVDNTRVYIGPQK